MPAVIRSISYPIEYEEKLVELGVDVTKRGTVSQAFRLLIDDAIQRLSQAEKRIAELEAENNRLAELNDKAVFIQFENEDELPADISNDVYSTMFNCSHVDGVRLFPYIEENGQKYFLVMLREDE